MLLNLEIAVPLWRSNRVIGGPHHRSPGEAKSIARVNLRLTDRTHLPRPCPTLLAFQADEIWDGCFQSLVFVALLLLDLLSGEITRALFL